MLAFTKQTGQATLVADYDAITDALYISVGDARPSEGRGAGNGVVVRYPLTDPENACGVVVRRFVANGWVSDLPKLATLVAKLLSVDRDPVFSAISPYRTRDALRRRN